MLNKLCLVSVPKHNICAIVCTAPNRSYSQEIKTISNPDTAFLKRGTGGRSSFNGIVATVFGATGFLGRFVCSLLGKTGTQIIIPHRSDSDDYDVKKLKLCGDLGQVLFQPFDLRDQLSIRKAIKYSNVVINLIGSDFETRNFNYYAVHVKGAKEIAQACRELNVERLIHFSSMGVTENPKRYYLKKLQFLPTKLKGEEAVLEEFPNATIFRPSNCYGTMDRFLWPLCCPQRCLGVSTPLYARGKKTIKQPVYALDVAKGVVNAIKDYDSRGKIYQAVGPEKFYLSDISLFCSQILQRHQGTNQLIHDIKLDPFFPIKMFLVNNVIGGLFLKKRTWLSLEQIERESVSDEVSRELPTLEDLGVTLTKMEDKVPSLILKTFKHEADRVRTYEEYIPADSLSAKSLNDYVC